MKTLEGEESHKLAAVREVYLLVVRSTKNGAVFSHPDYPDKKCVLFMNDPRILEVFDHGKYNTPEFEALPFPALRGAELMRKASTDGYTPLFANRDPEGKVIMGFIGSVRTQKIEVV
jgi:hypothetical protein